MTVHTHQHLAHRPFASLASRARAAFFSAPIALSRFVALSRQRRSLAELDDHMLDDIGIDRDTALAEAGRPVWDVPATWRD